MNLNDILDNETLNFLSQIKSDKINYAFVHKVDTHKQLIKVLLNRGSNVKEQSIEFPINNPVTNYGAGLRVMPIAGRTLVNFYEDTGGKYYHLGYQLNKIEELTDDRLGDSQDRKPFVLMRYLSEGEVQLAGSYGNEVYLPVDGSVIIKSSLGSHLKLDNYMSRLDGSFANMKFELDGVRMRLGNIIRPSKTDTTDDQYIVKGSGDVIKGSESLADGETYTQLREFTVQVGTLQDYNNKYRDYVSTSPKDDLSPTVGTFSIADTFIRENGRALFTSKKPVRCILKVGTGQSMGGFMVDEEGSFFILDYNNWSSTKFSTHTERALRLRKSYISIADQDDDSAEFKTEIALVHESNASIEIREGYVRLQSRSGRYFEVNDYGLDLNQPEAAITMTAKDIAIIPDGGSLAIGGFPIDAVLKATFTSTLFDTHVHTGPMGPPMSAFQWTPYIQIPGSPLVAQGLKVT